MHWVIGNKKIGKNALILNRPSGPTCPVTCAFHPESKHPIFAKKCYMARLESINKHLRKYSLENLEATYGEIRERLIEAYHSKRLVRIHSGGDFYGLNGRLDTKYVAAWFVALVGMNGNKPQIVCYTHIYERPLALLQKHLEFFASVHDADDIQKAKTAGFKLFALAMEERKTEWTGGAWVERYGEKWLVCPEQRGKLPTCEACKYCWQGKGNVAFLEHSSVLRPGDKLAKKLINEEV